MRQKLTFVLFALLCAMGAWATEYTVTYSKSTGSYTATNANGTWASKWVSTATDPQVTLSVGANNIAVSTGYIYSGGSGCTYTLTAQAGYLITGYTIEGTAQTGAQTLTPAAGGSAVSFATSGTTTLTVSGLSVSSTSFQQSTPNSGIAISSFTITLEDDPEFAQWKPSIADDAFLTVGEKVSSISAVTDVADNSKWYIVTQVRNGESPMYDAGAGNTVKRAAATVTPASLNETNAKSNAVYLVRFFSAGEGLYNIQFANGDWIDGTLKTTASKGSAGAYAFYNSNGGSGSYFGWNLNSTSGSIVDNNGAGNGLAFWGSGTVSGTTGNNVWYVYETTVEVPTVTIDVTYEQYVNGVATGLSVTETVMPNSSINVPANFTSGYNTIAYDISTEGTIADADVTIKVNINKKEGLVEALSELSNSKAYTIKCPRGTYTTNNGNLANTVKNSAYSVNNFAIISYDGKYYLWSVAEEKFVSCDGASLGDIPVAITMTSVANGLFKIQGNGKTMNATAGFATGGGFDSWSTTDEGNSCAIIAAADFDATDVIATIEVLLNTKTINLAVNVTGITEAENTRAGKITMVLNDGSTYKKFLYAETATITGLQYLDMTFTAIATSYRGYEFTGFTIGGTDYGTSIEAGELTEVADGATLVANYTASTGNGINLWFDYSDDMADAYRLPALIRTQSGRIVAFADYRPGNTDVGIGPTSIERRYSDDGGETWSPAIRVAQGEWGVNTENVIEWSFGDPAAVADNTPGNSGNDVLMVCCGGNSAWTSSVYNSDVSQRQQGCVRWRSTDGGVTWGNYEYIMPALMQACEDAGVRAADGSSGVIRAFFSSGKITQSVRKADGAQYNRIYNALNVNTGNLVIYSDDFGDTWKVLGNQVANNGDEAHVVELPDGAVLLVGKGNTSRYVNVFNYTDFTTATGEWGPTNQWNNAVTTTCHGDVEVVEAYDAYGEKNTVVIETSPMTSSPQRREIQYYFIALPKAEGFTTGDFSTQGGASWTQGMNVTHNWGAYSSILNNGNGTFDIFYEESTTNETQHPTGYCMVYQQNQNIKDITLNQFFFDKAQAEAEGVKTPRPGHFYRFKGSASNYYLTPGTTTEGSLSTTNAVDATTIWYYSTEGLVSYSTGLFLDGGNKSMAPVGTSYKAAIEPNSYYEGKYTIYTNSRYSYDRETNHTIDRGTTYNNDVRYAWTVEEVGELPVTISSLGLATLYSPVDLTTPEGVKVYAATQNDTYVHFGEVEAVKAGTGVLVEAAEGTYNFTIENNEADYESDLVGSVATVAKASIAATVYTLQSGPAFKQFTGDNVTGFRSHIEVEAGSGVKAFNVIFGDDETGLKNIKDIKDSNDLIYNLAGQRMNKAQKGVNIINGKKILK